MLRLGWAAARLGGDLWGCGPRQQRHVVRSHGIALTPPARRAASATKHTASEYPEHPPEWGLLGPTAITRAIEGDPKKQMVLIREAPVYMNRSDLTRTLQRLCLPEPSAIYYSICPGLRPHNEWLLVYDADEEGIQDIASTLNGAAISYASIRATAVARPVVSFASEKPECCVLVENVDFRCARHDLVSFASNIREIGYHTAHISTHKGRPTGRGYIRFATPEEASICSILGHKNVLGSRVASLTVFS